MAAAHGRRLGPCCRQPPGLVPRQRPHDERRRCSVRVFPPPRDPGTCAESRASPRRRRQSCSRRQCARIGATLRWRGNTHAKTYDVGVRRAGGPWRTLARALGSRSLRVEGIPGTRTQARVRARDAGRRRRPVVRPALVPAVEDAHDRRSPGGSLGRGGCQGNPGWDSLAPFCHDPQWHDGADRRRPPDLPAIRAAAARARRLRGRRGGRGRGVGDPRGRGSGQEAVLLDVLLPDRSGLDVAAELAARETRRRSC